jgi:hypothetical protein
LIETEGEAALDEFIARHRDGTAPPVVLSDAWPPGQLPRPILDPLSHEEENHLMGSEKRNALKASRN